MIAKVYYSWIISAWVNKVLKGNSLKRLKIFNHLRKHYILVEHCSVEHIADIVRNI
jgi:uncharacterized Fe-S cluster protein YjdI